MDTAEAKRRVAAEVDRLTPVLLDVSHRIHERPELCFEEHFAHDLLAGVIEDAGISVERGAYELETAFDARVGDGDGPAVAVLCEYDALPDIGHACGHNIIAAAGFGRRPSRCSPSPTELGGQDPRSSGTPGRGRRRRQGSASSIRRGAFAGVVAAALMVHPSGSRGRSASRRHRRPTGPAVVLPPAFAAHAAAAPEMGRNALDAAVLGYNAVAALRQHIRDDERIHGIFTDGRGQAQRGARPRPRPSGTCARPRSRPSSPSRTGWRPASPARPRPPGARSTSSGSTRSTPT